MEGGALGGCGDEVTEPVYHTLNSCPLTDLEL